MCNKCEENSLNGYKFCPECGSKLKTKLESKDVNNIFEYLASLDTHETYDMWRFAFYLVSHKYGRGMSESELMTVEFLEKIKQEVELKFVK